MREAAVLHRSNEFCADLGGATSVKLHVKNTSANTVPCFDN